MLAVLIGIVVERSINRCIKSTAKTLIVATLLYLFGLLAQTWFGLIKPLEASMPKIWNILLIAKNVIGTTRNGVFEGFFFICFGRLVAEKQLSFGKKALPLLLLSIVAVYCELVFVTEMKLARAHDMMLTSPFMAIFLFDVARNSHLRSQYGFLMRKISSLMYFTHLWVDTIVRGLLSRANQPILISFRFLISLCGTLIVSYVIVIASQKERLRFLKSLY